MQDHQDQRHSRHSRAMAHGMANPQRCPLPLACQVLCRRVYQKAPLWPQKGMSVFRVVYSQQAYYIYYLHITITYYNYTIYVYIFIFIYLFSMYLIYTINFWTRVHTPASILGFHHKDLFDIILISTTKHIYIYCLYWSQGVAVQRFSLSLACTKYGTAQNIVTWRCSEFPKELLLFLRWRSRWQDDGKTYYAGRIRKT
jgi:hypothetical protein